MQLVNFIFHQRPTHARRLWRHARHHQSGDIRLLIQKLANGRRRHMSLDHVAVDLSGMTGPGIGGDVVFQFQVRQRLIGNHIVFELEALLAHDLGPRMATATAGRAVDHPVSRQRSTGKKQKTDKKQLIHVHRSVGQVTAELFSQLSAWLVPPSAQPQQSAAHPQAARRHRTRYRP